MAERLAAAEYRALLAAPASAAAMLRGTSAAQTIGARYLDVATRLMVRAGLMTEDERAVYLQQPARARIESWATGELAARVAKLREGLIAAGNIATGAVKTGVSAATGAAQNALNAAADVWLIIKIVAGALVALIVLGVVFAVLRFFR